MARVLIIEDEESLLRMLCAFMEEVAHEPVGVRSADAARALRGERFDLVLADRILPDDEDGENLRPLFPGTPFLTMSGERPADVTKPFSLADLGAAIHRKLREVG